MKSGKLNIGNRSIKPAKKIDETHATPAQKAEPKTEKKREENIVKVSKKEPTKTTSIRLKVSELEKINEHLKKNEIGFTELIKTLLKKEGIL